MLSNLAKDVAQPATWINEKETVGTLKKLDSKKPLFLKSGNKIFSINRRFISKIRDGLRAKSIAVQVSFADPETPLYKLARYLIQVRADSVPISEKKGVTEENIIRAILGTKQLLRTSARMLVGYVPVVKESYVKNAHNIAEKGGYESLPVVNASGHLVGLWKDGAVKKKFSLVREGTRIKSFLDKALAETLIVVDKQRKPIGKIGREELLELAASLKEYDVPIYYSGMDSLNKSFAESAKRHIEHFSTKLVRLLPVNYLRVVFSKKGVWSVNVKASTFDKTFFVSKESEVFDRALNSATQALLKQVLSEKK